MSSGKRRQRGHDQTPGMRKDVNALVVRHAKWKEMVVRGQTCLVETDRRVFVVSHAKWKKTVARSWSDTESEKRRSDDYDQTWNAMENVVFLSEGLAIKTFSILPRVYFQISLIRLNPWNRPFARARNMRVINFCHFDISIFHCHPNSPINGVSFVDPARKGNEIRQRVNEMKNGARDASASLWKLLKRESFGEISDINTDTISHARNYTHMHIFLRHIIERARSVSHLRRCIISLLQL